MMHPVSLAAVGNGLSGAAHDAQPPTASSARGESGAVVRLTAAPLWGTHCSGRGGAPVAGLLLGESPGLLGHLTVQGAPIDLHHGVRRWSRRQGSKCAEGGRRGEGPRRTPIVRSLSLCMRRTRAGSTFDSVPLQRPIVRGLFLEHAQQMQMEAELSVLSMLGEPTVWRVPESKPLCDRGLPVAPPRYAARLRAMCC